MHRRSSSTSVGNRASVCGSRDGGVFHAVVGGRAAATPPKGVLQQPIRVRAGDAHDGRTRTCARDPLTATAPVSRAFFFLQRRVPSKVCLTPSRDPPSLAKNRSSPPRARSKRRCGIRYATRATRTRRRRWVRPSRRERGPSKSPRCILRNRAGNGSTEN